MKATTISMRQEETRYELSAKVFLAVVLSASQIDAAWARVDVAPVLTASETYLENTTTASTQSGSITKISPAIGIDYSQARLDVSFDYALNAIFEHGLNSDNRTTQNLSLVTQVTHDPGHWTSRIDGKIQQSNISVDGVQLLNDYLQSDNRREVSTLALATDYQNRLSPSIDIHTGLGLTLNDVESLGNSQGQTFSIALDAKRNKVLNWNIALNSRRYDQRSQTTSIDDLSAGLNYRFDRKYSAYVSAAKSRTDNHQFNATNSTLGMIWMPNRNKQLNVGIGKRGDNRSYFVDGFIKRKRLELSINYSEQVTTSSALLSTTSSSNENTSLSATNTVTPLLLQSGRISLVLKGRRSDLSVGAFENVKNITAANSRDETTRGLTASFLRRLSSSASLSITGRHQSSDTTQNNRLQGVTIAYNKTISKKALWTLELADTRQNSSVLANEYHTKSLNIAFNVGF